MMSFLASSLLLLQAEPTETRHALIEALHASHLQWQEDVDYKGTTRWRTAEFDSATEADHHGWNWDKLDDKRQRLASGIIVKHNRQMRISYIPARDPVITPAPATPIDGSLPLGSGTIEGVGYDEITDHRFDLRRYSASIRKHLVDDIAITRINTNDRDKPPFSTRQSIGVLTPVRPMKTLSSDPFAMTKHHETGTVSVREEFETDLSGRPVVTLTATRPEWYEIRTLTFDTTDDNPLVSVTSKAFWTDGRPIASCDVALSDFVPTGDGVAARRIRVTSLNSTSVTREEFYSPDIGNVPPATKDFHYAIPQGIRISGLKNPELIRKRGYIDLTELREDDLVNTENPVPVPPTRGDEWRGFWSTAAAVAAIGGLFLTALARMRR